MERIKAVIMSDFIKTIWPMLVALALCAMAYGKLDARVSAIEKIQDSQACLVTDVATVKADVRWIKEAVAKQAGK